MRNSNKRKWDSKSRNSNKRKQDSKSSTIVVRKNDDEERWSIVIGTIIDSLPISVEDDGYNSSRICSGIVDKHAFSSQVSKADTIIISTNDISAQPLGFFLINAEKCERCLICGSGQGTGKDLVEKGELLLNNCEFIKLESLYTAIPFHYKFGYILDIKEITTKLHNYMLKNSHIDIQKLSYNNQVGAEDDSFLIREVLPYIKRNREAIVSENQEVDSEFPYDLDIVVGRVKNPVIMYISKILFEQNKALLESREILLGDLEEYIYASLDGKYPMIKGLL